MNRLFLILLFIVCKVITTAQYSITGKITAQFPAINAARVTLFNRDTTFFKEVRSNDLGSYLFSNIPTGNYVISVAKPHYEYVDTNVSINNSSVQDFNFTLLPEKEMGSWDVLLQSPEKLGGTDLGMLMPDGKIYYCHNTKDPFYFDPVSNITLSVQGSDSIQGCVGPVLLPDSTVWFFGGTLQEIYGPGTKKVKKFNSKTVKWQPQGNMSDYRWYPSVSPLSDGNILLVGGGGLNNPIRVKTSELYNPKNGISTPAGQIAIGNEVSPILPLLNGKTLMTHRPPQLFDRVTNQWKLAADFVQGNRMSNGDHSDHELVLMPDGNVFAIGYKSFNNSFGTFVERYDPTQNKWTLKTSINPIRSRAKAIILPDKTILVAGGYKEDPNDNSFVNQWGYMKRTDIYLPETDQWRNADDMNYAREYHAIITLVPDGRLIAVGGEGQPGNEPSQSIIEAFKPPYLFRGVRPEISNLNATNFTRGSKLTFMVSKTDSITGVLLMANAVNTHFMNSSSNRFIELEFTQNNGKITARLPTDSLLLFDGFYMLFAMVDDIPSIAKIVKVSGAALVNSVNTVDVVPKVSIYPNPFNNIVFMNSTVPIVEAKIIDIKGHEILSKRSYNLQSLSLGNIEQGSYFLYMFFKNDRWSFKKIIKISQ